MRTALALVFVLGTAGCNLVFGLEPGGDDDVDPSGDGGSRDGPDGPPGGDDDQDGVPNGMDNCPGRPNPTQADEDGDAEINGGDACDLCPHNGGATPGVPHADADGDGLGDECDPSAQVRHCMRWFDGFSDPDTGAVLARYTVRGGLWRVESGRLFQDDETAATADFTVTGGDFTDAVAATHGRLESLPTTGTPLPYRNAVGVSLSERAGTAGTCYGSITRDVTAGIAGSAKMAVASRLQSSELVAGESAFPPNNVPMVAGERFGVTLDNMTDLTSPVAAGALFDRGASHAHDVVLDCPNGSGGVRTAFARASFEYFLVIEVEPTGGCPPRGPEPAPSP